MGGNAVLQTHMDAPENRLLHDASPGSHVPLSMVHAHGGESISIPPPAVGLPQGRSRSSTRRTNSRTDLFAPLRQKALLPRIVLRVDIHNLKRTGRRDLDNAAARAGDVMAGPFRRDREAAAAQLRHLGAVEPV